jgi:hypothetical protein
MDRRVAALGRHVTYTDGVYWVFAIAVVAIGTTLSLLTGMWGLVGLVISVFALLAIYCRKRYEKTLL